MGLLAETASSRTVAIVLVLSYGESESVRLSGWIAEAGKFECTPLIRGCQNEREGNRLFGPDRDQEPMESGVKPITPP